MDQEDALVPLALLVRGRRAGQDLLEEGRRLREVAAGLGDGDLEVGGLHVLRVGGHELAGHGLGLVEAPEVAQGPPLEVEGKAVGGVGGAHRLRLGERLLRALRLDQDLAESEPDAHVARLDLQRLAIVEDRLVGLLRAGVDVAEDLVGPGRARLQLERRLEGVRGLVGLARHQQVRSALDVGLEVAGVEGEVQPPRPGGLGVLAQLAVDAGQVQERLAVGGPQPHHLLVLRRRPLEGLLRGGARGLDLLELGEDEARVGVLRVERDRGPGLLGRLVELAHLAEEARRLHPDRRRGGVELLGPPVLGQGLVAVAGEAGLQAEAEVVVRLGAVGRRGARRGRRLGRHGEHESTGKENHDYSDSPTRFPTESKTGRDGTGGLGGASHPPEQERQAEAVGFAGGFAPKLLLYEALLKALREGLTREPYPRALPEALLDGVHRGFRDPSRARAGRGALGLGHSLGGP